MEQELGAATGGCRCGAIRYSLPAGPKLRVYACHCLDCQTWSGSAFSEQAFLPETVLAATGELEVYEVRGPSGFLSRQRVCGVCHTRIFNTNERRPGIAVLRAGTLDHSDQLEVVAHIWTKRKQPWLAIPDTTPSWPEAPPMAEFMAVVGPR